jgi:hypothetical protein
MEPAMKKLYSAILFSACTAVSINTIAQTPAPTTHTTPSTPDQGNMMGEGMKHHGMMHNGMKFGADNTPGWSMMSRAEHKEHRDKMHGMKTYDECKAYHDEHMKQMEARAKEKGKTLNTAGMMPCEMMRDKGMVK